MCQFLKNIAFLCSTSRKHYEKNFFWVSRKFELFVFFHSHFTSLTKNYAKKTKSPKSWIRIKKSGTKTQHNAGNAENAKRIFTHQGYLVTGGDTCLPPKTPWQIGPTEGFFFRGEAMTMKIVTEMKQTFHPLENKKKCQRENCLRDANHSQFRNVGAKCVKGDTWNHYRWWSRHKQNLPCLSNNE